MTDIIYIFLRKIKKNKIKGPTIEKKVDMYVL